MLKVKGIYDGAKIVLLDPVSLAPNTRVEVLIPESDMEQVYWQRLVELGLIKEVRAPLAKDQPFTPVHVTGAPLSQTIIEERR
jgi:Fe2+ transport system protein FeoA